MLMKKILLLTFALLVAVLGRADNELYYGFYTGTGAITGVGTQKAETYDVAIYIDNPDLVGMEIRGLRVPVNTKATNAGEYTAWLTKELKVESGVNVPDIASVSFTPDKSWVDVDFETPYVVTEGGFYAGYSFKVSSVDTGTDTDPNKKPLQFISGDQEDKVFIHTSRTFRKWTSLAESALASNGVSALVVRLAGDRVKANSATFVAPDDLYAYALVGTQQTVSLTLINHGVSTIKSINYTIEVNGEITEKTARITLAGTYYGRSTVLRTTIPAVQAEGTFPITFRITKLNDMDNEDEEPSAVYAMAYLNEFPKHKPLMEEYTGTWCGWCPRGMAAMEAMTEIYGDDFVGAAYHNGDIMTITESYPNEVSGFPNSYIDRVINGDPFGGSGGGSLGIQNDWKRRAAVIAPATIELSAGWSEDNEGVINVVSKTHFIRDFTNSPYRLTYLLVADDLTGSGKSWAQSNYFAGNSNYAGDKYLAPFTQLAGTIVGLKYKDVVIYMATPGSSVLANSLPSKIKSSEPVTHEWTIDVSENALVQDKTKLRVVAVLVNTLTGEVAQAEKAPVAQVFDGIRSLSDRQPSETVSFTDLSGRRVASLGRGIYVKKTMSSDGNVRTTKVIRR